MGYGQTQPTNFNLGGYGQPNIGYPQPNINMVALNHPHMGNGYQQPNIGYGQSYPNPNAAYQQPMGYQPNGYSQPNMNIGMSNYGVTDPPNNQQNKPPQVSLSLNPTTKNNKDEDFGNFQSAPSTATSNVKWLSN